MLTNSPHAATTNQSLQLQHSRPQPKKCPKKFFSTCGSLRAPHSHPSGQEPFTSPLPSLQGSPHPSSRRTLAPPPSWATQCKVLADGLEPNCCPLQQPKASSAASTESTPSRPTRSTPHPLVYPDLAAVCSNSAWHPKLLQTHPTQLLSSARAVCPLQQTCLLTWHSARAFPSRPRRSIPAQMDIKRTSLLHG